MNDLISRQTAIDACLELWEARRKWDTAEGRAEMRGIDAVMRATHDLPSAQPEIIRCKDCKYWNEYEHINGKLELFPWCELNMTFSKEDDFCSHAERRSDG